MQSVIRLIAMLVALSIFPCLFLIWRKHSALSQAEQCAGTVARYEEKSDSDGSTYALVIEYQDRSGRAHQFTTGSSSNPPSREIGDRVMVFHYADGVKPDVLVFQHLYLGYWIWFCVALCILGCLIAPGVMIMVYSKSP